MINNSCQIIKENDIEIFKLNEETIYKNGYVLGSMYIEKIDINKYYHLKDSLYSHIKKKIQFCYI